MSLDFSEADLAELVQFVEEQQQQDQDVPDVRPLVAELERLFNELKASTMEGNHLRALSSCVAMPPLIETIGQVQQYCVAQGLNVAVEPEVNSNGYV